MGGIALSLYICLDVSYRIHSKFFVYSLWQKAHPCFVQNLIVQDDNETRLRDCSVFLLEFPSIPNDRIRICDRWLFHFWHGHWNLDWIATSTFITSTSRLHRRELVLNMLVSCGLIQFFFELYQDCRSTFVASQKLSIPWFKIALQCKNGDGCLSSTSSIDCPNKENA